VSPVDLLTGEGVGEEPNHTTFRKSGLSKSFNTLWEELDKKRRVIECITTKEDVVLNDALF
jgi:hypothetical protein